MAGIVEGKVVLVTGGSQGIGRAAAFALAREGARVAVASRTPASGERAAAEIRAQGGDAMWIQADVTKPADVKRMVQKVVDTYGQLDCAFNNGGSGGGDYMLDQMPEEEWQLTLNGYLNSVMLCMKYELQAMLRGGIGAIVNNSSVDGKRGFPMDPAYSAAKHGVLGLTKSTALQYARRGIRINAVCPGWIRTPLVEDILEEDPDALQMMLAHQPIGRLGRPEEVAAAVVWLCSDQASLVTGASLDIDGGYLAV